MIKKINAKNSIEALRAEKDAILAELQSLTAPRAYAFAA